jgi:hypothetical protein
MLLWKTALLGNTYNATRKVLKAQQDSDAHIPLILKIGGVGLVILVI